MPLASGGGCWLLAAGGGSWPCRLSFVLWHLPGQLRDQLGKCLYYARFLVVFSKPLQIAQREFNVCLCAYTGT